MKVLVLALLLGFISCHPDIPEDPVIVDPIDTIETNQYVELVWKRSITSDTTNVGSRMPVVSQNKVGLFHILGGPSNILTFRNALSGESLWSWEKPSYFSDGSSITNRTSTTYEENLVVTGYSKIVVINVSTGQEIWEFDTKELGNYCGTVYKSIIGGQIYLSVSECNSSRTIRKMFRSPILNKNWELIYENTRTDGFEGDLMPPSLHINSNGDSLLIFQDRVTNFIEGHSNVDLMAFNLRSRLIEWKIKDIDPEGNSNVRPPTVYQDKVFFMGQRTIYCVSADSGKAIWKRQYPKESDGSYAKHFSGQMNLPVIDNLLISHPDNQLMEALDPNTGVPIWIQSEDSYEVNKVAGDPYEMIPYKDYIIYSSQSQGGVCIHKLFNGELRYRLRSPSLKKSSLHDFTQPIAIDHELGLLYACDGWFWYCYKLKI